MGSEYLRLANAVLDRDIIKIKNILDKDIDKKIKSDGGGTIVHYLMFYPELDLELWKVIVSHPNIDLNKNNNRGFTALHIAVLNFIPPDCIKLLLQYGADPNIDNTVEDWYTPFEYALRIDRLELINLFLYYGGQSQSLLYGKYGYYVEFIRCMIVLVANQILPIDLLRELAQLMKIDLQSK